MDKAVAMAHAAVQGYKARYGLEGYEGRGDTRRNKRNKNM